MSEPILSVRDLRTYFNTPQGVARAVDGVSFDVRPGETLAIVGESGCGKSVTSLSIMGLLPRPAAFHPGGEILFQGQNLLAMKERELRRLRGAQMAMIFQEPMTSLNPIFRVGAQIGEVLRQHKGISRAEAREAAIGLLDQVGISDPARRVDDYPHQMSGGMKQRVMIAMALAMNPRLLIADEPTTALDVTVQAQILDLLKRLQVERDMGVVLITHDLGVVAEVADRVVVMYAGRVVESADADELFERPRHPYTLGLFRSLPHLDGERGRLETIPGMVPRATQYPTGCRFRNRCGFAGPACGEEPVLAEVGPDHAVACWQLEAVGAEPPA
ncbi:MAG: ABC transporter ATP-binding protein [Myxococcales bacterium]|nr:ABC transporter ATP-binding protein [Myxococcales bacterium]MCB9548744.1 ABC transporter ATP-binding protein [Myxococcales bacterium]